MNKKIKILFQSRTELFDKRGGDTSQIENTKKAIEALDDRFEIDINNEINVSNINDYDIVNLFNIDWICETYPQALWAKAHNKKAVLSAIHHSYKEVEMYEEHYLFDIRRIFNTLIKSQEVRDIFKNIYRSFLYPKKIFPTYLQIKDGIRNTQRKVIELSDAIAIQTQQEEEDIKVDFGISNANFHQVVLGVDNTKKNTDPEEFKKLFLSLTSKALKDNKFIISIGRIEPRKNQLTLIDAFENLIKDKDFADWQLIFIGQENYFHPEYNLRFKNKINNENIFFLGKQPFSIVASALSNKGISVQPSWFETIGLTTLEAAFFGMKVITSCKRVTEYLGEYAYYCDPISAQSISDAIKKVSRTDYPTQEVVDMWRQKYTWQTAAKQTIDLYTKLLS